MTAYWSRIQAAQKRRAIQAAWTQLARERRDAHVSTIPTFDARQERALLTAEFRRSAANDP